MNSINLVQSNVDSLPPPNSDIALWAKLAANGSSPPLTSPLSSCQTEPQTEPLPKLRARRRAAGPGFWLRETLLSRWKSYQERLEECQKKPTVESIHQLRVASRRLISQFVLLSQILPIRNGEKARKILKRQLESLGALRDTQVQQIFIKRQVVRFPDLAGVLNRLERSEAFLVKRASRKICAVKTKKLQKWIWGIVKVFEQQALNRRLEGELASSALSSAGAAFAEVVQRWRMIDRRDVRTIHRTRVAFKKFRYIVECLPPELSGFGGSELRTLARYQRRMGNIQDFDVILGSVQSFMKHHEHSHLKAFCRYFGNRRTRAVREFLKTSNRLFEFWPPRTISQTSD